MNQVFGIDTISFYTPNYYLDLKDLAAQQNEAPDKFSSEIGQHKISITPPGEDIVTLGANAAQNVLAQIDDPENIDTILFATESGVDYSKSAGIYVQRLLNIPKDCRVIELKEACYASTGGLQIAMGLVMRNPSKKVLLIASDIARYELNSPGEPTQGSGAVAMIISANPRLIAIEPGYGIHTEDVMDFWKPNYLDHALVQGKFSSITYLKFLSAVWKKYQENTGRTLSAIDHFCYHIPLPKLVEKAHKRLTQETESESLQHFLSYPRVIGNSYTASLFVGLCSLLDHESSDLSNKRIGFYSYGSGSVGEYICGIVSAGYRSVLNTEKHQELVNNRQQITYDTYKEFYDFKLPQDGSEFIIEEKYKLGSFRLAGINNHKRDYVRLEK